MFILTTIIQYREVLVRAIIDGKDLCGIQTGKEKVKLSCVDDMILCREEPKDCIKNCGNW
jgi:hypothetical protein